MVTTRPKGSSAQWLSRASPPTPRQLFACNVASGSNFGTGRGSSSLFWYVHGGRIRSALMHSASTRAPFYLRDNAIVKKISSPRPVPKLSPFEIAHKSAT